MALSSSCATGLHRTLDHSISKVIEHVNGSTTSSPSNCYRGAKIMGGEGATVSLRRLAHAWVFVALYQRDTTWSSINSTATVRLQWWSAGDGSSTRTPSPMKPSDCAFSSMSHFFYNDWIGLYSCIAFSALERNANTACVVTSPLVLDQSIYIVCIV
jgi:hypothetical protein